MITVDQDPTVAKDPIGERGRRFLQVHDIDGTTASGLQP